MKHSMYSWDMIKKLLHGNMTFRMKENKMKEIKLYICEYCGTEYSKKSRCNDCEKAHKKPVKIRDMRYLPVTNDATGYPQIIEVEMDDGKVVFF